MLLLWPMLTKDFCVLGKKVKSHQSTLQREQRILLTQSHRSGETSVPKNSANLAKKRCLTARFDLKLELRLNSCQNTRLPRSI